MLTGKELLDLNMGDVVEVGEVFQAVTDEPVCFKLASRSDRGDKESDRTILTFEVWYHSILIGEYAVKVDKTVKPFDTTWVDVGSAKEARRCQ